MYEFVTAIKLHITQPSGNQKTIVIIPHIAVKIIAGLNLQLERICDYCKKQRKFAINNQIKGDYIYPDELNGFIVLEVDE